MLMVEQAHTVAVAEGTLCFTAPSLASCRPLALCARQRQAALSHVHSVLTRPKVAHAGGGTSSCSGVGLRHTVSNCLPHPSALPKPAAISHHQLLLWSRHPQRAAACPCCTPGWHLQPLISFLSRRVELRCSGLSHSVLTRRL